MLFLGSTCERCVGTGANSSSGSSLSSHVVRTQIDATILGSIDWPTQVRVSSIFSRTDPTSRQMTGVIDKPLLRLSDRVVLADAQVTGVKHAITHYDVLTTTRHLSLVALRPHTGRTHQLRVHCSAALHCAIFGDARYSPEQLPAPMTRVIKEHSLVSNLHLHARELCFEHPVTRQMLHFTAPLPAHMQHTLTQLDLAPDLTVASRAQLNTDDFERVKRRVTSVKTAVKKTRGVKKL